MFRSTGAPAVALAIALLVACSDVENAPAADPTKSLDETVFRCSVEPILVRQCSYNACHGIALTDGAALRVYSPGKLRAMQSPNIDTAIAVLTEMEHHANFQSAAGFSFGTTNVDDNWLLRKPLPSPAGGYEHKGGAIWRDTNDAQYSAIRSWLSGTGKCTP
jgi:hypothetical protein